MKTNRVGYGGQLAVIEDENSNFSETAAEELENASTLLNRTFEILPPLMTEAEALRAIEEINSNLNRIRALLVELGERQGYTALGFENMSQLMQSSLFSKARSTLQRELQAGRIERHYLNVPVGTFPERHFRPLSKLKPEYYRSAFGRASNSAKGGLVTEKHVTLAVAELLRSDPGTPKGLHRRQWFTGWQLNLLATIEKIRGGKK